MAHFHGFALTLFNTDSSSKLETAPQELHYIALKGPTTRVTWQTAGYQHHKAVKTMHNIAEHRTDPPHEEVEE